MQRLFPIAMRVLLILSTLAGTSLTTQGAVVARYDFDTSASQPLTSGDTDTDSVAADF